MDENLTPYLNEIAEKLWSGHASVMIGAGFSKKLHLLPFQYINIYLQIN